MLVGSLIVTNIKIKNHQAEPNCDFSTTCTQVNSWPLLLLGKARHRIQVTFRTMESKCRLAA